MRIRTQYIISFIVLTVISGILTAYAAIYSISQKYQELAELKISDTRKNAESYLIEYNADLTRKALLISEMEEITNHFDDIDALQASMNSKSYFLFNTNVFLLDKDKKIILTFRNAQEMVLNQEIIDILPLLAPGNNLFLRDSGIFPFGKSLCLIAKTPLVIPNNFEHKGYILLETFLDIEFADSLHDRLGCDIIIRGLNAPITTTFIDKESQRVFPSLPVITTGKPQNIKIMGQNYLIDSFPITDNSQKVIGTIQVAININDILIAKKHAIRYILYVLAGVVFLVVIFSLLAGKRLTRSISKLSSSAKEISKGNFNVQIHPTSTDEIGQLSHVFNDMTHSLKKQRNEIMELTQFFEKVIENAPSAIIIYNVTSNSITLNPSAQRVFDIPESTILDKELFEIIPFPSDLQADFFQVILTGSPISYNSYRFSFHENDERIYRLTFYQVSQGENISIIIQAEDLTKNVQMEEDLMHAQKMGTLGDVLSRFTHEFNNLMTGIIGHISLLKKTLDKDKKSFDRILKMEELSQQAQHLGKNILSFSKKEKFEIEKVDIKDVIDSILNLVEKTVLKGANIETKYFSPNLYITANREKLQLALLNLLINARDALLECKKENPFILITAVRVYDEAAGRNSIRLQISDNGTGIEKKNLPRIFEPYFTTKGKKGTGLGLATVKEIIEACNGTISVESIMNEGTTFSMHFPE